MRVVHTVADRDTVKAHITDEKTRVEQEDAPTTDKVEILSRWKPANASSGIFSTTSFTA